MQGSPAPWAAATSLAWSPAITACAASPPAAAASPAGGPGPACAPGSCRRRRSPRTRRQSERRQQRARRRLRLVGADRQPPALIRQRVQGLGHAGKCRRRVGGVRARSRRRTRRPPRHPPHGRAPQRRARPASPRHRPPSERSPASENGARPRPASAGSAPPQCPARNAPACRRDRAAGWRVTVLHSDTRIEPAAIAAGFDTA